MSWSAEDIVRIVAAGAGATLFMDGTAWVRARFGVPGLDWGIAGRWVAQMPRGRFVLAAEAKRAGITAGERLAGWLFHYAAGIFLAALLAAAAGPGWLYAPDAPLAIGFGVVTVAFPFCLMQPGLGAGFAGRSLPRPWLARWRSLVTHFLFGCGLFLSTALMAAV